MLDNKIQREWAKTGSVRLIDLSQDYYLVQFASEEDYKHALFEGPWLIADHYIVVQRWRPFFTVTAKQTRKIAARIRIPGLPIELFNDRFLWRVGSKLGTMLKIDKLTSIQSRGRFARICVEIDLKKKLVPQIDVLGHILKLEYEGLHSICFKCGKYGHKQSSCPQFQNGDDKEESKNQTLMDVDNATTKIANQDSSHNEIPKHVEEIIPNQNEPESKDQYGPWMIVKRKKKSFNSRNPSQVATTNTNTRLASISRRKDRPCLLVSPNTRDRNKDRPLVPQLC
uniref:CCHC-type domain-containing protein n=1 Tax=Cajanus cajan TaxID=3821 RepID=A0A151TP11_CAJCA|nr:hypothetical protein KK1_022398 [Cajanus cajan]KYP68759.1 hypothetical protein KK1_022400 [Cajanus cajan]